MRDSISPGIKKTAKKLLAACFWLTVWQLAAVLLGKELLLPRPLTVFAALAGLVREADFWILSCATLLRIFAGLAAGLAAGTLLAALCCLSSVADALFSPLVHVIRATPVASFIILAIIFVESAVLPGLMAALMVLPIVWGNVCGGVRVTDGSLLELARAYRFGRGRTLMLVFIPSVKPYFISACSTGMGMAWKAGVAAEVLCQPKSAIGTQLYYSKVYFEIPELFAWTVVIIVLSFMVESVLGRLLRKL